MNFEFIQATEKDRAYLLELRKSIMVEHLEISGQFLSDEEHEIRLNDAYNCHSAHNLEITYRAFIDRCGRYFIFFT
jgi:hypothetical protein